MAKRGLLALLAVLAAFDAHAITKDLDYIVAIVDDDVVLASELVSRLDTVRKQMTAANMPIPPSDVLFNQMLERLIMEEIQLQMGQRAGVRIDDETLTTAIESIAKQNNMTIEQFTQALEHDGMNYREFREEVRREMIIQRVQRNRVNSRIYLSDEEIDAFLASPLGKRTLSDEYRVGHILLAVADDAPSDVVAAAERKANDIYVQLKGGADFRQLAVANSADSRALEGGDLGWRKAGELPSLFAEQVFALSVGETAEPIRSGSGFHIVQLLDKRGASTEVVEQTLVRHILVKPSEIRSDAETEALINDIYKRILAGEDFGNLARTYSEDPGSGLAGGDLGWSEPEKFVPEFAEVMKATEIGKVSKPFHTSFGWHVLEVMDRRQHDMSEDARRNLAVRVLHNRRYEEELQEWLREIRDEAYVDIKVTVNNKGESAPGPTASAQVP
jgi:peptidyl-prolyl cis-trans isomerase SurA